MTACVSHCLVAARKASGGPPYARPRSKMPVRTVSGFGGLRGAEPVLLMASSICAFTIDSVRGSRQPASALAAAFTSSSVKVPLPIA